MSKRITVSVLGRTIGTATGWDGDPSGWTCYYDFEPKSGIDLPIGDLYLNDNNGTIGLSNEETGEPLNAQDVVTVLSAIPRDKPIA